MTNQNLNEPMRSLINDGYLVARIGEQDRRHKRLFATPKGSKIYRRVIGQQLAMLEAAFTAAGPEATRGFLEVQRQLVGSADREWVARASLALYPEDEAGD